MKIHTTAILAVYALTSVLIIVAGLELHTAISDAMFTLCIENMFNGFETECIR